MCFLIFYLLCVQNFCVCEDQQYSTTPLIIFDEKTPTEIPGGLIINQRMRLEKSLSPFLVREDIIIDVSSELSIDPGVEIRFAPMVGITVRGILNAKGTDEDRIVLRPIFEPERGPNFRTVRLVDGPTPLSGRLQILHHDTWRSVCTNSRNWTVSDLEVVCRDLGFQGGSWGGWIDREPGIPQPRLLLEQPNCRGTEASLQECDWGSRQLGAGVCDYHPDLAVQCLPSHVTSPNTAQHWRGIRFERAPFDRSLTLQNTLYVHVSMSELSYVDIRFAGSGRDYNATAAIQVDGVPPVMKFITVTHSAYTGINVTTPGSAFSLHGCSIRNNRGYGLYVNTSMGGVLVDNCIVTENGADGIKYVQHNERIVSGKDIYDFCTFPTTASQTFPLTVSFHQNLFNPSTKDCSKYFFTKPGYVLTYHFLQAVTDRNESAKIIIYDGGGPNDRILAEIKVRNNTIPQSVTTTRNNLYIRYVSDARTELIGFFRITSGYYKWYDLNVTDSTVNDNNGRGIAIEKMNSHVHIQRGSISNNNHVAGIHVLYGTGDVNVTDSRIAFNKGDGLNISYTGGSVNVTRSSLSSNNGYGVAVWLNDTKEPEFISYHQETVVAYSEIFRNVETGILVGNFCSNAVVNITGNWFNLSLSDAVEVVSCWRQNTNTTKLQIGHNVFIQNKKLGIKIKPAVNLDAVIEFNRITGHQYGGILIKNDPTIEEFELMPSNVLIRNNEMFDNRGVYVINIGLSPYSELQKGLITWNFIKDNRIKEPFDGEREMKRLIPRSKVAAPLVVSSANVHVYRNIFQNHDSEYEIGSQLEDQSQIINCTFNWLSYSSEEKIYRRLFHRKDRYNLAKIEYVPFLLHSSNPGATTIMAYPTFVPQFQVRANMEVGGEVDGVESLRAGEYLVSRDINIRPGGRLTLEPGVTLRFPPGVGMMVAGKLEARGRFINDILLTLRQETTQNTLETETEAPLPPTDTPPVRLLGGRTPHEGRLQVRINEEWGTVCDYGWNIRDAALVCHQLGLVLNPYDWFMLRADIPVAGTSEKILLSNVRCTEEDLDITECRSERAPHIENSCTHEHDVGLRCYEPHWAGVRLGVLAERCYLQYVTVEHAGLLDYATNTFKPALQVDFSRHALESVRLVHNVQDGLGVIYSDIHAGSGNLAKNCEFSNNRGSGISFKQLGFKISGSSIENNEVAGVRHNPSLTNSYQRELAGWFKPLPDFTSQFIPYNPIFIPQAYPNIDLDEGQTKYLITQRVTHDAIDKTFTIRCKPGFVVGIQLLNPIHNRSTENIIIYDSHAMSNIKNDMLVWSVRNDLAVFPSTSSSFGVVFDYRSGVDALGGAVIVVSAIRGPTIDVLGRTVRGPIPTLTLSNTKLKGNNRGLWASFYNRYLNEYYEHYLRKSNESIQLIGCDLSHNKEEAIYVDSPYWNIHESNISEITILINNTLITDNGRGILQFSRDLRNSNNLFHWHLHDNSVERNSAGGLEISLPYVWQYNENFTHSVRLHNNTWRNNNQFGIVVSGHFARLNITLNVFEDNICRTGLISIQGMEKRLLITKNTIERNSGTFMLEFKADSQSEIMGDLFAECMENLIKRNKPPTSETPSSVIVFDGLQRVRVRRNLLSENNLAYALVAGVRTARLDSSLDVTENWWGTTDLNEIKTKIFDFDDWNNHALANFKPYLIEESFEGSLSASWDQPEIVDLDNLGGRLSGSITLHPRDRPYILRSDLTVMPDVTLTITPGVVMEFAPRVGILVLGSLIARGRRGQEIILRPHPGEKAQKPFSTLTQRSLRLCTGRNCIDSTAKGEGFLEYLNSTTLQWVPICDSRFSEKNAEVVCRELGLESLNAWVSHGPRVEFHPNSLTRIWSYPEPVQCSGDENRLEECDIRLNGQLHGIRHVCYWNSNFVFIKCGHRNLPSDVDYWGGIRFASSEFEQSTYEHRVHDAVTHETVRRSDSYIEYANITGAGFLHNLRSPAILAVSKSPVITNVNISNSASHGISLISPVETVSLLFNWVQNNLGVGITIASLTGEGRESGESSFTPAKNVFLPHRIFSLVDMCDPAKEIIVQERMLVYYKYENRPVSCVKIFYSAFRVKPFGFRLLQFNLVNSTDEIQLYDGNIYLPRWSKLVARVNNKSGLEKKFITTRSPSLSIKMVTSGAAENYGFIAEIVTLPISAIGFNRDVQHNISFSALTNNWQGAVQYVSAGEVNPRTTLEWNQIKDNCVQLYGNFTTCKAAVEMDLQNTQNLHFRNNLVKGNQGGLWIRADSRGTATSLKGWIHNNLFFENHQNPALSVEGRQSSPYQEVTIYRNYWARNNAPYQNIIKLNQVVSNFTYNYVHRNLGSHILEVSGFERVRLPIYQTTSHNGFYWNYAVERDSKGTIVAGTAGQHYIDNILFNPDNDYEIVTVNRSLVDFFKTPIDAKHNYWGFNETWAVGGRIKDRMDEPHLLEVDFRPFHMSNCSILDGKCPPGWSLVGDTCYIYVGAPMTFREAREFCRSDNASMPYVMGNHAELYRFLRKQQENFNFYDRVWVQHIDKINQCTVFVFQSIEIDHCQRLNPFVCEMDPKVLIDPLSWRKDVVTIAVLGSGILLILLILLIAGFWYSKSRHRHSERLQRRNSIRQSLHSVRSIGSSHGGFSSLGYSRKGPSSQQSSPTLNKNSDYKKMNGSVDSMDKSQLNSSLEDTQSYDIYEAHNPSAAEAINHGFDLSYRNQGFRDNSTFASRDNSTWQSTEDYIHNSSTLPLNASLNALTDSTLDGLKSDRDYQQDRDYPVYYERPKSSALLETNLDDPLPSPVPPPRAKSEALLETNLDYPLPPPQQDLSTFRSKSQPLETAM